jgi:hypothetical protein
MLIFVLALSGCPRTPAPETTQFTGTAVHPWQLPGYRDEFTQPRAGNPQGTPASATEDDGTTQPVTSRGPAFATEDTLDEALIPGQWLQVCTCVNEQINIPGVADIDTLELRANGTMVWQARVAGAETTYIDGNWTKSGPGQISLRTADGQPVTLYSQLYQGKFLFIWSYEQKLGHWFARMPETGSQQISRNRFRTTFGNMIFTEVGNQGFHGVVLGEYERTIGGFYLPGVITMRWEESATNSGGYAAFLVDPTFNTLDGVWWLDDYEAAPFGGPWTGTADDTIQMPAVTAGAKQKVDGTEPPK